LENELICKRFRQLNEAKNPTCNLVYVQAALTPSGFTLHGKSQLFFPREGENNAESKNPENAFLKSWTTATASYQRVTHCSLKYFCKAR